MRPEPSHISEMTRPSFFGSNRDMHPIDFLHRLDEYFAVKQFYIGEKIIVVGDCLKGTAFNWFSTIRFQLRDYDDFRKAFIDEYWSREIQIQIWSQCLSITHVPQNTNFREHFATWATKLRHLEVPRLSEPEIVKHIAKHYPGYLRAILVSMPERTILSAMKILGEEGQNQSRKDDTRHQPNNNNQQENNRPNNSSEGQATQNNWNHRSNNRNNNRNNDYQHNNRNNDYQHNNRNNDYQHNNRNNDYQHNNRNNSRHNNQNTSRENNQQINQVSTSNDSNEPEQTINQMEGNGESFSPYIQCLIEGEEVEVLVDTGATISVLTKEVVDTIIKKNPRIPQLPVTGVKISNAVGKQICKTSKQVFCQFQVGEATIVSNFIQVEGLNERGIIGSDILNKYNMQIDFDNHTIRMKIAGQIYFVPFSKKLPKVTAPQGNLKEITVQECNEERKNNQVMISDEENEQFDTLMNQYAHIFSNRPGKITAFECQIRTTEGTPIYQKPYSIPVSKNNRIDREIQRMLDLDIIETSTSPWSSPMVGIEKKNGDIRICIDARKINTRIIPDRERPMNIEDIMNKFQGVKYLSSIDLTAGYWQCPLRRDCREITAFLHKGRNYQYKVGTTFWPRQFGRRISKNA
ncbi:AP2/ERF domain-containing protein PFD0985w-like [Acyrthosiphon pisum]|uniref:Peptidase A2 domain-containing protein n=1 Tax=Acyrthosiphon pisum TaxID=7029 RepID=A0A8R2JX04_ACYPI|nr:AP2/ERF domain-containing protein PFD0985w-like [Acyrthosiphon pisum]